MTSSSRARFAETVHAEPVDLALACLLIGCEVEPELDIDESLALIDELAATARPLVTRYGPAKGLRLALGGFGGSEADYEQVQSSLLHEVLRRRSGLPVLLSVLWCEVADRLDLLAVPLGLPGHVLVCLGDPLDQYDVVDPFNGGVLTKGPAEPVLHPVDLLLRVLTNLRALATRQPPGLGPARTQLWATELSLLLPHHPITLRRERGELLVRLGSFADGARELEDYASLVEDVDEAAAVATRQHAQRARAQLN